MTIIPERLAALAAGEIRLDPGAHISYDDGHCSSWQHETIRDLGSGMNYRKKGLVTLIDRIVEDQVGRIVLTHKDRLLRFGAELIFSICEAKNVEVVIINQGDDRSFEEELASDLLEIVTVFSARMYGARSRKNQRLIDGVREVVDDVEGS